MEADLPDRQGSDLLSKSSSSLISPLAHSLPLYGPETGANTLSPCLSLLRLKGRKAGRPLGEEGTSECPGAREKK